MSYQGKNAHSIHWYHENLVWTFPQTKENQLRIANTLLWWGWNKDEAIKTVNDQPKKVGFE